MLNRILARQDGQTMAEYALLLVLIFMLVVAALSLVGPAIRDLFVRVTGMFG